ncbi:ankyrin repeat protein [Aureobasidium pullulans]|nr:ankyrin repeat protein [Aureobasidium pullulans]
MLNEEHPKLPQSANDHNVYALGSVQGHNVVVAGLPTTGNCSAATVVAQMRNTFPRLRFGLLVGIGGGVPTKTDAGPLRLGHIVVSKPVGQHSGAVQYDHGKAEAGEFVRTGFLAPPPTVLLNAASALQVHRRRVSEDPLILHLNRIDTSKRGLMAYKRPSPDQDQLYEPDYIHLDKYKSCKRCGCEASKRVNRDVGNSDDESAYEEDDDWLVVHRGTIASGEAVMRNGLQRDALAGVDKILCFEMEAAGALNDFPCLVVRGMSDYSDSHKNDKWHGYAAAVAAAYARELFFYMPVDEVKQCKISETDVNEMVQNTKKSARAADYTEDLRIKKWLGPADTYINCTSAFALHHEDTGRWFLEGSRYESFRNTPDARLWLRGIPGCGKTVLASTVIHDLQKRVGSTASTVIFFFFSFSNESKQKLDHMLRSLISQLSEMHQTAKDRLVVEFKKHDDGQKPLHGTALQSVFGQMVDTVQNVTIVLDALDESATRTELLKWITSFPSGHGRFLLTSRSEMEIEDFLTSWLPSNCTITLENEPVGDDIKAYVRHRLDREKKLSRWDSMRDQIERVLVDKAAGMFQWVYCQLEELSECLDKSSVRRMLGSLPLDLDETYDRILQNIPRARVPNAIKLLQLLAFSKRPLRLEEVVDAIATEPDAETSFDADDRLHPPHDITEYCPSLMKITYPDAEEPQLQLAHFSVREYLVLRRKGNPHYRSFKEKVANAMITRVCLAYLWTAAEGSSTQQGASRFPLAGFAARYWLEHAGPAGENKDNVFFWTQLIFTKPRFMLHWLSLYDPAVVVHATYGSPSPLYYASLGGLERSVVYLIKNGSHPGIRDKSFGNVLEAAATSGNLRVARLLLDEGAEAKANCRRGSPIIRAIYRQDVAMASLLIEQGFDVTGPYTGGSAMRLAATMGNVEMIQLLLRHGANVDAEDGGYDGYGTPLHSACAHGTEAVVRLLLDKGADINYGKGGTALNIACAHGKKALVRLLIERDADVNAISTWEDCALTIACSQPDQELGLLLLRHDANPNVYSKAGDSALQIASRNGSIHLVELLLNHRADVNAMGQRHISALQAASENGHLRIVELLLDHGADVNAIGQRHISALQAASQNGHLQVLELLLRADADVNLGNVGREHYNALNAACFAGHAKVVATLLEHGADVNSGPQFKGNHLQLAARNGHLEVVKILLEHNESFNAPFNLVGGLVNSFTDVIALGPAARNGHVHVVLVLLKHGADIESIDSYHERPLIEASRMGHLDVVQLLLRRGAKLSHKSDRDLSPLEVALAGRHTKVALLLLNEMSDIHACNFLGTPLQSAAYSGDLEIVELLIRRCADVNFKGGALGTALLAAVSADRTKVVEVLLQHGADVNVKHRFRLRPLEVASPHSDGRVVQLLLEHGADTRFGGFKQLYSTCLLGPINNIRLLLHLDAGIITPDNFAGFFMQACKSGNVQIVEILKRRFAKRHHDYHRKFKWEDFIPEACSNGNIDVVKVLIKAGANIRSGSSALLRASEKGHLQLARFLLHEGALTHDEQAELDNLPILAACRIGNVGLAKLLLDNGADANTQDKGHGSVLQQACHDCNGHLVELLITRGASIDAHCEPYGTALQAACVSTADVKGQNPVWLLLHSGADANIQGGKHGNALCAACGIGNHLAVLMLIEKGVDINMQGGPHKNALQLAVLMGRPTIVQILIENGADESSVDKTYRDPFRYALDRSLEKLLELQASI